MNKSFGHTNTVHLPSTWMYFLAFPNRTTYASMRVRYYICTCMDCNDCCLCFAGSDVIRDHGHPSGQGAISPQETVSSGLLLSPAFRFPVFSNLQHLSEAIADECVPVAGPTSGVGSVGASQTRAVHAGSGFNQSSNQLGSSTLSDPGSTVQVSAKHSLQSFESALDNLGASNRLHVISGLISSMWSENGEQCDGDDAVWAAYINSMQHSSLQQHDIMDDRLAEQPVMYEIFDTPQPIDYECDDEHDMFSPEADQVMLAMARNMQTGATESDCDDLDMMLAPVMQGQVKRYGHPSSEKSPKNRTAAYLERLDDALYEGAACTLRQYILSLAQLKVESNLNDVGFDKHLKREKKLHKQPNVIPDSIAQVRMTET